MAKKKKKNNTKKKKNNQVSTKSNKKRIETKNNSANPEKKISVSNVNSHKTKKKTTNTKKNITKNNIKKKTIKKIPQEKINNNKSIKKNEKNIKKVKNNNKLYILLLFIILLIICVYKYLINSPTPFIKSIILENNNVIIKYDINKYNFRNNIYCLIKQDEDYPNINDNWIKSNNNMCIYELDDKIYYAFLKNEDNEIFKVDGTNKLGVINNLSINEDKVYLPLKGTFDLKVTYDKKGYVEDNIIWKTQNDNIATIKDGKVTAIAKGKTTITAKILDKEVSSEIIVTDLITIRPKNGYDYKKKYLSCNKYSKEENDLIDEILKSRIEDAGYKTRAGVVEAARFLTLDFPYRINYFYENGRQTTNNVDGEGIYYHVGFYLHKSRYKNITGSKKGPKVWGCSLYSSPAHRNIDNGLDCSGFVSWALLNGGFNVKDVGAGWSDRADLTDYGTVKRLTKSIATSNKIKVGDLLHSEKAGGHIGIIVGIDKNNYYVAQALWYDEIGVIITKINKAKLQNHFPHAVLMDKYYKKDGNLTNMW